MDSIAIDIGNTRIKAGLFLNGHLKESAYFLHSNIDRIESWILRSSPEQIIISSTADEGLALEHLIPPKIKVLHLDSNTSLPIKNEYRSQSLGQDRIANAVAGYLNNPKASLIIDAGTCITYDWTIDESFKGGSISPGLRMRLEAMHHYTGRLPLIKDSKTDLLIGRDTEESIRSGAFFGIINEIQGIISTFKIRYPQGSALLTGGDCLLLANAIENDIFADPFLTLKGLNGILQFNNA